MNTSALVLMLLSQGTIAALSIYFFVKVIRCKPDGGSFCKQAREKTENNTD